MMKGTVFLSLSLIVFAAFGATCNNVATSRTAENSNAAVVTNSATTEANTTTNVERAFKIDFKTEPGTIQAGTPSTLSFTVKDKQGEVIKDLQIVHEKPMHLLVVSSDLAEFYHIHPEPQADGSYAVAHVFPNGGDYKFYADFTPKDAVQVVERIDVKVAGAERAKVALAADSKFEKTVDGLKIVMKPSAETKAGQELMLDFQAFDAKTNKPATDLQNYLGELAHFVLISEDLKDFVHAHPMAKGEHKESGKMNDAMKMDDHNSDGHEHSKAEGETNKPSASEVSAHTAFPRSGLYKIWAQFQRGGKVITVPFVVNVKEADKNMSENKTASIPEGAVKVTVSSDGYEPASIKVKKGQPVKLAFTRTDANNCGGEVVFAKQNIRKKLPVGETVLVEFSPTEAGEINFACGMNMMRGKLVVSEN
ncbi:MAG: cupredoxin domain-containing protein [Pyrinomonadaceae bacterium]|nr:cupredoxin domain-containing protein [Pyrinomonadaceae bacterium]